MKQITGNQLTALVDKYKADKHKFTKFFCMRCFSTNIYTRKKTGDFVCRKCGEVTLIKSFDDFVKLFTNRKNHIKRS